MPEYDGSIVIDSHIDTSNFDKDASKLFDKAKKVSSKFDLNINMDEFYDKVLDEERFKNRLSNILKRSSDLGDYTKISDISSKTSGVSESFRQLELNIGKAKNEMITFAKAIKDGLTSASSKELHTWALAFENAERRYIRYSEKIKGEPLSMPDVNALNKDADAFKNSISNVANTINKFKGFSISKATETEQAKAEVLSVSKEFEKLGIAINKDEAYLKVLLAELKNLQSNIGNYDVTGFIDKSKQLTGAINTVANRIDLKSLQQKSLLSIGESFGKTNNIQQTSNSVEKLGNEISKAKNKTDGFKNSFSNVGASINRAFSGIGNMFTNAFSGISKLFATITRRTQWILLGQTIRAVIADAKESIADLRTYNQDFDKSMQSIRDSFKNVGNAIATSFAPILQALAPIIANVARWLTELFNKITLFTTALFTGSKTAVIADTSFSGYAKSTKKATANTKKGTKAIKEQTKALAKFDKLDVFKQDKAKSPASGIADAVSEIPQAMNMFKTVEVPRGISEFANKLKETFRPLADEFKVIGDSFQKNFVAPVYKHIRENILPRFLDSTRERIAKMDFTKLNSSLDRFFSIMAKITINLFDGLEWGWEHVLLPMIDKTITDYLPKFLDALTSSLQILNFSWQMAKPYLKTLVTWLKELGDPIITGFLDGLNDTLGNLKWAIQTITPAIESLGRALESIHIPQWLKDLFYNFGRTAGRVALMPGGLSFGLMGQAFLPNLLSSVFNFTRRRIPGFASGTVVSPNRRFLAMLGDNTSEAEVVSPVSTMKQAFMEAMYETGMNTNNGNVVLQLDGTTFARLINPYTKSEQNRIGISMVEGVAY